MENAPSPGIAGCGVRLRVPAQSTETDEEIQSLDVLPGVPARGSASPGLRGMHKYLEACLNLPQVLHQQP